MALSEEIIKERACLVLYTDAICDLNCNYCFIDKNPVLKKIDKLIENSFNEKDYYLKFAKEIFPYHDQVKQIQFWGGEPTLGLLRAKQTVIDLLKYYDQVNHFMFSTNFIGEHWFEIVEDFFTLFEEFPDRTFSFNIQLSLDGPTELNDIGRGIGTTKKFLKNFKTLVTKLQTNSWIPKNIKLSIAFKPTLSNITIGLLQTKQAVLNYYKFFDSLCSMLAYFAGDNFTLQLGIPNFAEPSPVTVEIANQFTTFCKWCYELQTENSLSHDIFKTYTRIMPYPLHENCTWSCQHFQSGYSSCGAGRTMLGLLPYKKLSLCHNGFVSMLGEYKEICAASFLTGEKQALLEEEFFTKPAISVRSTICDVQDLEAWSKMVAEFFKIDATFQVATLTQEILELAKNELVLEKYKELDTATKAARYIMNSVSPCLRNNMAVTGSMTICPLGTLKLLLNGALDYIIKVDGQR